MSYEIVNEKSVPCPCGQGLVKYSLSENDWGQMREHVSIECPDCKNKYEIKSMHYNPKPKHDYTVYYAVSVNGDDRIQLDL